MRTNSNAWSEDARKALENELKTVFVEDTAYNVFSNPSDGKGGELFNTVTEYEVAVEEIVKRW